MRWLVFFLLIFNGFVFLWSTFQNVQHDNLPNEKAVTNFDFSSVDSVELLSELPQNEIYSRDVRKMSVDDGFVDQDLQNIPVCALVGPFYEVISAKQTKGRLEKKGLASNPVLIINELPSVNWTYIPPYSNRSQALAVLKELQERGVDSFLISDGEFANGISLGNFSSLEAAKRVQEENTNLGYSVKVLVKKRLQNTYWVGLNEQNSLKINDDLIDDLKDGYSELKKQEKPCVEVALLPIIE